MPITNMQDLPINDFLRDDILLKVTDSYPWYANIVNFMVSGYIPPGDDPYLYRVCSDGLLRRCVPTADGIQIIEKCHSAPYGGNNGVFRTQAKI